MSSEPGIVDDLPEGLLADLSLADVRVTIYARAETSLRIVQVEGEDLLQPDERFDLTDGRIPTFWRAGLAPPTLKASISLSKRVCTKSGSHPTD